jgi:hypothetical protein
MIHYLWFIPSVIIVSIGYAWLSIKSQELGGIYFWVLAFMPIPLWALVTRVSNNLLADGLIYDIGLMLGFALGLIVFGAAAGFTTHQYIGLGIAICGIILMKI